ncbi:MAG: hypothetical protein ACPHRO_03095 [Nannocystaceae bacterium]
MIIRPPHLRAALAALTLLAPLGCTKRSGLTGGSEGASDGDATDSDADTDAEATGSDTNDASGGSDESGTCGSLTGIDGDSAAGDTGGEDCDSFLGCMDVACLISTCDWWAQDCGAGQKCSAIVSTPGSGSWDANVCMSVGCEPPGAPCMKVDDPAPCSNPTDTCDATSICMSVDADTGIGTCVEMCTGSPEDPACPQTGLQCAQLNGGVLNLCVPGCDPLLPGSCPDGEACSPAYQGDSISSFICLPAAAEGISGESCECANCCADGHTCTSAASYGPNCADDLCCTEYCDLNDAAFTCAGQDQQCIALFDASDPNYADVGACQIPT